MPVGAPICYTGCMARRRVLRLSVDLLGRAVVVGVAGYELWMHATNGGPVGIAFWSLFVVVWLIPLAMIVAGLLLGLHRDLPDAS